MASVKNIFIGFVSRSNTLPREQAAEEFDRLNGKTLDEYLTMARIGASFRCHRELRRTLYLTYENAQNHAGFEEWIATTH